jgi:hypothetical protein
MKFILGAISVALSVASCQPAYSDTAADSAAPAECTSKLDWAKHVAESNPAIRLSGVTEIKPETVPQVVEIFNKTPPVGAPITADSAVLLHGVDAQTGLPIPQALVGLFKGGCRVGSFTVPVPAGSPA